MNDNKRQKNSMTEDSILTLMTQAMMGEATEQARNVFRDALRALVAVA